jgi:hypothetical protein
MVRASTISTALARKTATTRTTELVWTAAIMTAPHRRCGGRGCQLHGRYARPRGHR